MLRRIPNIIQPVDEIVSLSLRSRSHLFLSQCGGGQQEVDGPEAGHDVAGSTATARLPHVQGQGVSATGPPHMGQAASVRQRCSHVHEALRLHDQTAMRAHSVWQRATVALAGGWWWHYDCSTVSGAERACSPHPSSISSPASQATPLVAVLIALLSPAQGGGGGAQGRVLHRGVPEG